LQWIKELAQTKEEDRQKVFNWGLYVYAVGIDILKFDKKSTDL